MSDLDPSATPDTSPDFTRSEFAASTLACQSSVLTPQNDLGLAPELRHALAARMCRLIGQEAMALAYQSDLPEALKAAAEGGASDEPRLAALLRHVDLITSAPGTATRADIEALVSAGFTTPQIVALSELVAFINYETRIQHGHSLLEDLA